MTMSRWIIELQQALVSTSSSKGTDQFSQLLPTTRDEMLRDTKAIEEWKPHGIFTHSYLFFVSKFSFFYDGILLLEFLSHCTKALTQSQYKDIPLKVQNYLFSLLLFCLQKRPMIYF